jgi:hypothetical protein
LGKDVVSNSLVRLFLSQIWIIPWLLPYDLTLSTHENYGGMEFKSLKAFNLAILSKQAWKMFTNRRNLITRLFRAKYFLNCVFLSQTWVIIWATFEKVFEVLDLRYKFKFVIWIGYSKDVICQSLQTFPR